MKSFDYVFAAYIATWLIHGTYIAILVRKYGRVKKEMESLRK